MNKWRYDDVIRFVASIVFGTSFRQFHDVVEALTKETGYSYLAYSTTICFYLLFFRNVHGLIAYDSWAENSRYKPSFERKSRHVLWNFIFAFLAALALPYLFIYMIANQTGGSAISSPIVIGFLLFAPMGIYVIWNVWWLWKLSNAPSPRRPFSQKPIKSECFPWCSAIREALLQFGQRFVSRLVKDWRRFRRTAFARDSCAFLRDIRLVFNMRRVPKVIGYSASQYRAYCQMRDFTILWLFGDFLMMILILFGVAWLALWGCSLDTTSVCVVFSLVTPCVLLFDYFTHVEYYFPIPYSDDSFYEFKGPWAYILPDGLAFCHWGGRAASRLVISRLKMEPSDFVIEVCCGYGGTLSMLPLVKKIVGVDKSAVAIHKAGEQLSARRFDLKCADIRELPFRDGYFSKVYAQDGDAWLVSSKHEVTSEVSRVLRSGGRFVLQSYASRREMPKDRIEKVDQALQACGYVDTEVLEVEGLETMFAEAGFKDIFIENIGGEYAVDNLRMITKFNKNRKKLMQLFSEQEVKAIENLLTLERELFERGWWTGVLVTAIKE